MNPAVLTTDSVAEGSAGINDYHVCKRVPGGRESAEKRRADLFVSVVAPKMPALLRDLLSRPRRPFKPPCIFQTSDAQHAVVTGAPGNLQANLSAAYDLS